MTDETKTDLLKWISQSTSAFDLVICNQDQLGGDFKVLNPATLDQEWRAALKDRVGAFPMHKAQFGLQKIAHHVARDIAKSDAQQLDVSVNGLRNAWFHPVFSELATLLPIRHVARKIAAQRDKQPIAIPLKSLSFTALNGWSKNDLEPLYLAFELRRQNVPVVIFTEGQETPVLQFGLSKTWLPKGYPEIQRNSDFTTLMCKKTMRRAALVSQKSSATRKHKPGFFTFQRHFGIDRNPSTLRVNLQTGPMFGDIKSFSAPSDIPDLDRGFVQLIGPLTQKVTQWYRDELKARRVNHVHIADHATFEGGLLAAEVTKNGGQISIWPHSANLVHMHVHTPTDVAQVKVAAKSTAIHWQKSFGTEKVTVDISSILPQTTPAPLFDTTRPIHVILFAGGHALKRMPLVEYDRHQQTWAKVLSDLHNSSIDLTIKHKSSWETRDWITNLAPQGAQLNFSNTRANKLDLPNMVFLSISHASTALLEGIARGIPGMIIRDVPIDETPHYDPEFIPCLTSDHALEFITNLNSEEAMKTLIARQKIWFEQETNPLA